MTRYVGIDVGSTYTKIATVEGDELKLGALVPTLDFLRSFPEFGDGMVVSTGYGRGRGEADLSIPEIRAHVIGARHLTGLDDFTLLDIGGQDFKVTRVVEGAIQDFAMNDKCAAGTGRFLEKMSAQLDMSIEDIGRHWKNPCRISAVCAVFAESEVAERVIGGKDMGSVAAGINWSMYRRIRPVIKRLYRPPLVLSGGLCTLPALSAILKAEGFDPCPLENGQYAGAAGCAYKARQEGKRGKER